MTKTAKNPPTPLRSTRRKSLWLAVAWIVGTVAIVGLGALFWPHSSEPASEPIREDRPGEPPAGTAEEWIAEGLRLAEQLAATFPQPEAQGLAARFLQRFGDTDKAVACWQRCLKHDPRSARTLFCLGSAAWEKADYEQAVARLQQALAIDPNLPGAAVILGESLIQTGRPEEAAAILEKAPDGDSPSMRRYLLGQANLQLQQYDKAREHFEAALAAEPGFTRAHYGLMTVFSRLGNRQKAEERRAVFLKLNAAEEDAKRGMLRATRDWGGDEVRLATARLAFDAARLYAARGDRAETGRLLDRAVSLDPTNPAYRQARSTLPGAEK